MRSLSSQVSKGNVDEKGPFEAPKELWERKEVLWRDGDPSLAAEIEPTWVTLEEVHLELRIDEQVLVVVASATDPVLAMAEQGRTDGDGVVGN